ncbi:MAG: DUF4270 family protein [Ginsengibacter sp.]
MRSFLLLSLVCNIFIISSCTKIDNTTLGAGLIPAVDNVNTFDVNLNVVANNYDSQNCTSIFPTDNHVLGFIGNDPLFGKTTAAIFTELKPSKFPAVLPGLAGERRLDSIVLVLSYNGAYGDTLAAQKVDVYQLNTSGFKFDSSTCSQQTHDEFLLGSTVFTPVSLKDTPYPNNQLRIKLENAFGESLLKKDSNSIYKNDTAFRDFFRGFAIVPDTLFGGNNLTYYNLLDTATKLAFYYKYPLTPTTDSTVVVNFSFTALTASANPISHNREGAEITSHLQKPSEGDDVIYIQTAPGSHAQLTIPGLDTVSNRIIHRAELIMEQVYSSTSFDNNFLPPNYLYLETKISNDSLKPIPCDFYTISSVPDLLTFGGSKKNVKDIFGNTVAQYTFNMSRYVQKIVSNDLTSYSLKLSAPDYLTNDSIYLDRCSQAIGPYSYFVNNPSFGRVKLGGGNNLQYQMRLHIIYSRL